MPSTSSSYNLHSLILLFQQNLHKFCLFPLLCFYTHCLLYVYWPFKILSIFQVSSSNTTSLVNMYLNLCYNLSLLPFTVPDTYFICYIVIATFCLVLERYSPYFISCLLYESKSSLIQSPKRLKNISNLNFNSVNTHIRSYTWKLYGLGFTGQWIEIIMFPALLPDPVLPSSHCRFSLGSPNPNILDNA